MHKVIKSYKSSDTEVYNASTGKTVASCVDVETARLIEDTLRLATLATERAVNVDTYIRSIEELNDTIEQLRTELEQSEDEANDELDEYEENLCALEGQLMDANEKLEALGAGLVERLEADLLETARELEHAKDRIAELEDKWDNTIPF